MHDGECIAAPIMGASGPASAEGLHRRTVSQRVAQPSTCICRDHYIPHRQQDVVNGLVIERARRVSLTFRQVLTCARQPVQSSQHVQADGPCCRANCTVHVASLLCRCVVGRATASGRTSATASCSSCRRPATCWQHRRRSPPTLQPVLVRWSLPAPSLAIHLALLLQHRQLRSKLDTSMGRTRGRAMAAARSRGKTVRRSAQRA
jgi:hypothetical protein